MIGMIRFDTRGGVAEAILGDDGSWSCCAVPCLVHPLDILYSPNWDGPLAVGRHLEEAARWLHGVVVIGANGPIPGMARPSNPGGLDDLPGQPCGHPTVLSTRRSDRMSDRAAARRCRVDPEMIGLWVETGAWPMPRRGAKASETFGLSEVECWLATGVWPVGAHFRTPPEDRAPATRPERPGR